MPHDHRRLDLVLTNGAGLHARAATLFVRTAQRFLCEILVEKDGQRVDGKSILGLLTLAAGCGNSVTIYAAGRDAALALDALSSLCRRNFDGR